jgi:hypothetical protein
VLWYFMDFRARAVLAIIPERLVRVLVIALNHLGGVILFCEKRSCHGVLMHEVEEMVEFDPL